MWISLATSPRPSPSSETRAMRIGLLTTGFPRFEGDCSGAFLLTLARGLVDQGHSVRVFAPEPRRARPRPQWRGIDLRWLPYARPRFSQQAFYRSGAPDNLRRNPALWFGAAGFTVALRRAASRELDDCDAVVSSWCLPSGWVASNVAQGRPHLCICHATDVRWLSKLPAGDRIARDISRGATSFWFLSAALRDRFFAAAGLDASTRTCHLGSMPLDPPRSLHETRNELRHRLGIQGFTLLFLGRLVPVKGVDELIRALAPLPNSIRLRVAGDGPDSSKLRDLAARLGVHATFEGWVAGERKEALLRACDALVLPSRPEEGLPTVLFEARARGLAIISTRVGAIPDRFGSHDDLRLVPPNDREALRRAVEQLHALHTVEETGAAVRARPFGFPLVDGS